MEVSGLRTDIYGGMSSVALRGLQEASQRMIEDMQRLAEGEISPELVASVTRESFIYSMNIKLMKIADEMAGQVIDLLA